MVYNSNIMGTLTQKLMNWIYLLVFGIISAINSNSLCDMTNVSTDTQEMWLAWWLSVHLLHFLFCLYAFSFLLSLGSLTSFPYANTCHTLLCKHTRCINMQMLADANTHTFQLTAGTIKPLTQPLCWFGSQEPDVLLLNRVAWVFAGTTSNSCSLPTLH